MSGFSAACYGEVRPAPARFQDARDAYRLIGECRDLGSDPALWHGQMFAGLCQLIGVPMVTGGEGQWLRPHDTVKAVSAFQAGFDAHAFELYMAYMRKITPAGDPVFRALQRIPGRLVTRTRRQLVHDTEWYRSAIWDDYHRPRRSTTCWCRSIRSRTAARSA